MILAAGRGERMRPLTDTCPKPLLTVAGKPLIVYHLEALKRAGIESVVINVSWLAEHIQQTLGNGDLYGLRIEYSHEPEALETAGGIVHAMDCLDDEFLVVNGDIYTRYDFRNLLSSDFEAHLVLVENPVHNPAGDFAIKDGLLSNKKGQRHTFTGIARYRKSFFSGLAEGKRPLAPLLRKGADEKKISAEVFSGQWDDVGTVERLDGLE